MYGMFRGTSSCPVDPQRKKRAGTRGGGQRWEPFCTAVEPRTTVTLGPQDWVPGAAVASKSCKKIHGHGIKGIRGRKLVLVHVEYPDALRNVVLVEPSFCRAVSIVPGKSVKAETRGREGERAREREREREKASFSSGGDAANAKPNNTHIPPPRTMTSLRESAYADETRRGDCVLDSHDKYSRGCRSESRASRLTPVRRLFRCQMEGRFAFGDGVLGLASAAAAAVSPVNPVPLRRGNQRLHHEIRKNTACNCCSTATWSAGTRPSTRNLWSRKMMPCARARVSLALWSCVGGHDRKTREEKIETYGAAWLWRMSRTGASAMGSWGRGSWEPVRRAKTEC
ncbi:hypothetical protein BKA81DRAFT_382466 [Phyllosticta paracitricarpa]